MSKEPKRGRLNTMKAQEIKPYIIDQGPKFNKKPWTKNFTPPTEGNFNE